MKKFLLMAALCVSVCVSTFGKDIRTVTFSTKLHCENCVKKVVENVSFLKGVKDLDVSLEKQKITVTYDAAKTSVDVLSREIKKLGYPAVEDNAAEQSKTMIKQ